MAQNGPEEAFPAHASSFHISSARKTAQEPNGAHSAPVRAKLAHIRPQSPMSTTFCPGMDLGGRTGKKGGPLGLKSPDLAGNLALLGGSTLTRDGVTLRSQLVDLDHDQGALHLDTGLGGLLLALVWVSMAHYGP